MPSRALSEEKRKHLILRICKEVNRTIGTATLAKEEGVSQHYVRNLVGILRSLGIEIPKARRSYNSLLARKDAFHRIKLWADENRDAINAEIREWWKENPFGPKPRYSKAAQLMLFKEHRMPRGRPFGIFKRIPSPAALYASFCRQNRKSYYKLSVTRTGLSTIDFRRLKHNKLVITEEVAKKLHEATGIHYMSWLESYRKWEVYKKEIYEKRKAWFMKIRKATGKAKDYASYKPEFLIPNDESGDDPGVSEVPDLPTP